MKSLLIQSCSASKESVENPVPAIDLYDGYFFRIIKKALRAGRFRPGLDILIISAKHGIVEPKDEIGYYDQRMGEERARELNADIVEGISDKVKNSRYENVWINLGKDYLPAIKGLESAINVPINFIEGSGIGVKGRQLKGLVSQGSSIPMSGG